MSLGVDGDDQAQRLIADLLVRAGMLMEDFSVAAVSRLPSTPADAKAHMRSMALAGTTIAALTVAAWCLSEVSVAQSAARDNSAS